MGNSPDLEIAVRLLLESQGVAAPLLLQHVYDEDTVSRAHSLMKSGACVFCPNE